MSRLCAEVHPAVSRFQSFLAALFCVAVLSASLCAQESAPVPPLVKFTGTISGAPAGSVGVIFALYKDSTGGAPLWQEVQSVTVDAAGHYTAFLGSRSVKGIPSEVFSNGEAHWLAVQSQGQPEQPRVLLVSVPYALKASDAETLGGLPASAFLRADSTALQSSVAQSNAYVSTTAVNNAAGRIATAAIVASGAAAGYVPVFADAAGDLTSSSFYQAANGYVGIGTTTPAFNLNVISQSDPAAVTVEGYGVVGVNFIGRRARGSLAAPTALQVNDNIMAMQGRGYGATGFSPGSRAYMKFFAAENWTDSAQGTYITLATTLKGTASTTTPAPERLRITDAGFVGIGTTTPAAMLEVNGSAQFDGLVNFAGGQTFPGTVASVTPADTSITVGGTASAPTVALNTGFTNALYAPAAGSTAYAPVSGSANYVAIAGSTMTGALTLPANGLQMAGNQIVTSGGQFGYGAAPNSESLFDIGGSMTAPTYSAELLRLDGTVRSSYYAQAYLKGLVIAPTFNLTNGYANYVNGVELSMANITGSNVAHSVVGFLIDGQPVGTGECSVGFGIGVPNQQTSLCSGTYGFYQTGAQYNYFGSRVGIGTPAPGATLEVNGTTKFDGLVSFASGQTFPGAGGSVSITSPDTSITVGGTASAPTVALNTGFTNLLYAPFSGSTNYVAKSGDTMTGSLTVPAIVGATGAALNVSSAANQAINITTPNMGSGSGNGGAISITAGQAGYATGGSGGDVNVTAGYNVPSGGAGYNNLGAPGNVNITAGGGYNSAGGNAILSGGPTSSWGYGNTFSKASLHGGIGNAGDAATLDVEGGHTLAFPSTNGGNILLTAGSAQGGPTGGNIVLQPGTGSTNGVVQVNGNLNVSGTIQANSVAGAVATQGTPASSSAACTPPQLMYDANYVYTCVAANSWRRAASAAF